MVKFPKDEDSFSLTDSDVLGFELGALFLRAIFSSGLWSIPYFKMIA